MKRVIYFLFALALLLCGCAPETPPQESTPPPAEETTPPPVSTFGTSGGGYVTDTEPSGGDEIEPDHIQFYYKLDIPNAPQVDLEAEREKSDSIHADITKYEDGEEVLIERSEETQQTLYDSMIWHMPYLALCAREVAEAYPYMSETFLAIANQADALSNPEQALEDIGAPESKLDAVMRYNAVKDGVQNAFFAKGIRVKKYSEGTRWGIDYELLTIYREKDEIDAELLALLEAMFRGEIYIQKFNDLDFTAFFTEEEREALTGLTEPELTMTVDQEKGLRYFEITGLEDNTSLIYAMDENETQRFHRLKNGERLYIPLSYEGELYFAVKIDNACDGYEKKFTYTVQAETELLAATEVVFQNSRLETVVRTHIGKREGTLTKADLTEIESICVSGSNFFINSYRPPISQPAGQLESPVTDLSDFAWFDNLTVLGVGSNGVTTLNGAEPFISKVTAEALELPGNQIRDFSALKSCACTVVNLSNNAISDISPLKGMAIRHLDLSGNQIENGEAFAEIRTETLLLAENPLRALALHPEMLGYGNYYPYSNSATRTLMEGTLDISGTELQDLAFLDCKNAEIYFFRYTSGAENWLQVLTLPNLRLDHTAISWQELIRLDAVRTLSVAYCNLESLDFIKYWHEGQRGALKTLNISGNGLTLGLPEAELLRRCELLESVNTGGNTLLPEFDY